MLAVIGIGVALILGIACGGDIRRIAGARIRGETAVVIMFILQAVARGWIVGRWMTMGLVLWGLVSLGIMALGFANIRRTGMGVVAAGVAANAFVVLSNGGMPAGGRAPIQSLALDGAIARSLGFYQPLTPATHAGWLGDVLPFMGGLASLGDVLMMIGIAAFLLDLMLESVEQE